MSWIKTSVMEEKMKLIRAWRSNKYMATKLYVKHSEYPELQALRSVNYVPDYHIKEKKEAS